MTPTKTFSLFILVVWLFLTVAPVQADMTSTNYHIFADSVNTGGELSTSTNYSLQDTTGESPAGVQTSGSYEVRGGYQAMERGTLSVSLDSNSLNLGELSVSSVASASTVATITTDSDTGYNLSIGSVSGASLHSVIDGEVTAGQEEYGVAVSGVGASFADDQAVTGGLLLASEPGVTTDRAITLTFKASRAAGSASATYSQSIVLATMANF